MKPSPQSSLYRAQRDIRFLGNLTVSHPTEKGEVDEKCLLVGELLHQDSQRHAILPACFVSGNRHLVFDILDGFWVQIWLPSLPTQAVNGSKVTDREEPTFEIAFAWVPLALLPPNL